MKTYFSCFEKPKSNTILRDTLVSEERQKALIKWEMFETKKYCLGNACGHLWLGTVCPFKRCRTLLKSVRPSISTSSMILSTAIKTFVKWNRKMYKKNLLQMIQRLTEILNNEEESSLILCDYVCFGNSINR